MDKKANKKNNAIEEDANQKWMHSNERLFV